VPLDQHVVAWSGVGYRHLPAGMSYDVLDVRFAGQATDSRWNVPGEPTLYIAGGIGVAIAEFTRHFQERRAPGLAARTVTRTVYRLDVQIDRLIDLRQAAVWATLSLANAPACFMDRTIARATAQFVRHTTPAQALLVPSVAFLDDLARWVLVLFLEKLPADPRQFIHGVDVECPLRWR
jgi:RES domain-containing protein